MAKSDRGKGRQRKQKEDAGTNSWDDMQECPSEEPLERPEEAVERVEIVDMRCRVEDRM